MNCLHSP